MKSLPGILLLCALPVHADPVTLDLGVEAQQRTEWCWAAASVLGIRSFPEAGKFRHLTQLEVVARRWIKIETLTQAAGKEGDIQTAKTFCGDPDECNLGQKPLLFDIDSDSPKAREALTMDAIAADIDQNHPILIRWVYSPNAKRAKNPERAGAHELVITGYNKGSNEVLIFDPLPVGSTAIAKHERWLPYPAYLNPAVSEGAGVAAFHRKDQFRMRRTGAPPPDKSLYTMVGAEDGIIRAPEPGGFEPPGDLDKWTIEYMRTKVFRDSSGKPRKGKISTGRVFPVVAIGAAELLHAAPHPAALLVRRTGTYVVPVLEGTEVVDSFLLLRDGSQWRQGGYSNNAIASLVARLREERGGNSRKADDFYLVSIPELSSFFIAHGFNDQAELISLDYDGRGGFVPANKALGDVVRAAEKAKVYEDDKSDLADPPTRPR